MQSPSNLNSPLLWIHQLVESSEIWYPWASQCYIQDHSRRWVSLWPWHLSSKLFQSRLIRILNHVLRALMPIRYSVDIVALWVKLVKFECRRGEAGVRGKLHPQPGSLSNTDCHVALLYYVTLIVIFSYRSLTAAAATALQPTDSW